LGVLFCAAGAFSKARDVVKGLFAGVFGGFAQLLLDAQELVVLGDAIADGGGEFAPAFPIVLGQAVFDTGAIFRTGS